MSESLPREMQAITIREPGGPEVLEITQVRVPAPREAEVLVRVRAAGVNRPDILQRQGLYPVPADASPLPGLEIAGEVVATGPGVTRWRRGDQVMALTHGGGYAEYCRVNDNHCLAVPASLSLTEAAAVPETYFTVWYNMVMRAGLTAGESVLVHGGSSGIGTTAIQIATALGASVIATAGSDEKCAFCEQLGAQVAINYRSGDWEAAVGEITGGKGVDVVLDMVAGPYVQKNLNVLARDGRYALIAFLLGSRADLDLRPILARRLTLSGSTLRPQTVAEKAQIAAELAEHVVPLLESGRVRPIIHTVFPLAEASLAHALMEKSEHMGKIVLDIRQKDAT